MEVLSKIALTICSILFLILLMVSYFSKKRAKSFIKSDIYGYLLSLDSILLTLEILTVYLFKNHLTEEFCYSFLRLKFLIDILYFFLIYAYHLCYFKNLKYQNIRELIKEEKSIQFVSVYTIGMIILYFLLPFKNMTIMNYSFTPGIAYYFVVTYEVIIVVLLSILVIPKERRNVRNLISAGYLAGLMIVANTFQILNPTISIMSFAGVLHLYSLYFLAENPDLEYIDEIEDLTEEIEKASKTKSDFLSNMSHEIRTPMNAIVGFSETILNDVDFDEERAYNDIKNIENSGKNLLEIIKNILDISKIESGKDTIEEKEYSIAQIIKELESIINTRLEEKNVKLEMNVDKTISSKLYGDSTKLFQILLNLLTNSVKYTEVGKIRLELTHESNGTNELLKFKIMDTGYGIKKEDYDKLFEKFSRLDMAKNNGIEGTGLGLVITKKYVDLMGGSITFESDYGVGTTFYVDIPQKIIDKTPIGEFQEEKEVTKKSEKIDCSNYKILLVDDNKLNLKVAKKIFSTYHFQIDTATSGKECIYKYKEGTHYDMIILDHMMMEMDGIEVLNIINKLEGYDTPIMVVLTANAITGAKEMYLKEGFDEYLSKPIDLVELDKMIRKYFGKKEIFTYQSKNFQEEIL